MSSDGQVRPAASATRPSSSATAPSRRWRCVVVPRPSAEPFPDVKPHNFIDRHVLAKLRRLNIPPADLADDATFLRRVTLDVTGELPTPQEVRAFLADKSPDKRAKKIDELLTGPATPPCGR